MLRNASATTIARQMLETGRISAGETASRCFGRDRIVRAQATGRAIAAVTGQRVIAPVPEAIEANAQRPRPTPRVIAPKENAALTEPKPATAAESVTPHCGT